jgi:hypothetical protein
MWISILGFADDIYTINTKNDDKWEYEIYKNAVLYWDVDLRNELAQDEIIPYSFYRWGYTPPLSPDNEYYPFIYYRGMNSGVLLLDVTDKSSTKHEILGESFTERGPLIVEWITANKLFMRFTGYSCIIFTLDTAQFTEISAEGTMDFDSNGVNYSSIHGLAAVCALNNEGLESEPDRWHPIILRYNGYWVYPQPLNGYVSIIEEEEFRFENYDAKYSDLRLENYGISSHYVLSKPMFLGDSTYVGFIEQVYPHGNPNQIVETNVVALDAHNASTRPPLQTDIHTVKLSIAPIPVEVTNGYFYLSLEIYPIWNVETNKLEFWYKRRFEEEYEYKIGEVPVSFNPLQFGTYTSFLE